MRLHTALFALLLSGAPISAMAEPAKPTIVLVHGALETSAVWGSVIARLQHDGFTVRNVDLPGRPGNELPMGDVSLSLYQQTVSKAIANEPRPVVLVGHSFGGFTISAVAEAEPSKIKTLVYVAAYIPQSGDSLLKMATQDKGSKLGPILVIEKDRELVSVPHAAGGAVFANHAPASVREMIENGIVDEPLTPLATPVTLTAAVSARWTRWSSTRCATRS